MKLVIHTSYDHVAIWRNVNCESYQYFVPILIWICLYVCVCDILVSHITLHNFSSIFFPFSSSNHVKCVLIISNFISPYKLQGINERVWMNGKKLVSLKDKRGFYIPSADFIYSFSGADSSVFSCIRGSSTKLNGSITWLFSIYLPIIQFKELCTWAKLTRGKLLWLCDVTIWLVWTTRSRISFLYVSD